MTKKLRIGILSAALSLLLALTCMSAVVNTAFAEGDKTVASISYNSHEAIIVGEPVQIQAEVTFTDGTKEMRPVKYTEFPVNKMHEVFRDFKVRGYVEGSDEVIDQTIVVVPDNVEYLINLGSNLTETDYEYASEGVLGKELDPTGASAITDPFNAAIQRKFPEIEDRIGAKQFGQGSPSDVGDWGYVGNALTTQKVSGIASETGRNLFKHLVFPKRGTKDIEVKFTLEEQSANYDIYLGFYSYWFARPININLNGTEIENSFSVSPSENVYVASNRALSGEASIELMAYDRSDAYAQALSSFVCVTKADTKSYETPSAPVVPEALDLTDTEIVVSGITPNTVLQFYDYDKLNLLYEKAFGEDETEFTVPLETMNLNGVSRIGVCCSNAKGMGETAIVRRTDVENFTVSYEQDFVGSDLLVELSAYAKSQIVAIKVYDGEGEIVIERATTPAENWSDSVYLKKNGNYRFEVESGNGGKGIEERTIVNIDNEAPTLGITFNMETAKASTDTLFVLGVAPNSVSSVTETGCIYRGKTQETDLTKGTVSLDKSGDYTLYFINSLGKTGVKKVSVAMKPSDSVTANITEDTSKRFKQICFTGRNGYEIAAVNVYGNISGETEKMIVNGSANDFNFAVYNDGVYFAEIVTADGAREYAVINLVPEQQKKGCGSAINAATTGTTLGAAALCAVAVLLVKKNRKKQVLAYSEQSENK